MHLWCCPLMTLTLCRRLIGCVKRKPWGTTSYETSGSEYLNSDTTLRYITVGSDSIDSVRNPYSKVRAQLPKPCVCRVMGISLYAEKAEKRSCTEGVLATRRRVVDFGYESMILIVIRWGWRGVSEQKEISKRRKVTKLLHRLEEKMVWEELNYCSGNRY
jgi:hypothetical protein